MTKNIDDYYSSISSSGTSEDAQHPKQPIIKKKLKVKGKKIEEAVTPQNISPEIQEKEITQAPTTLNETLEKNNISKFQVISR
jgi:hypothetical protein